MAGFADLGLRPALLEALEEQGFSAPLPIQSKAIPPLLAGRDLVAIAETGSGKTYAYGLPMIQRLKILEEEQGRWTERGRPRGLVITPTRELADQVSRALKKLAHKDRLRIRCLTGGGERKSHRQELAAPLDILVATGGRLLRFVEQGLVKLEAVRFLVLDEADQLFEMGFVQELERVLSLIAAERQLACFSATLPRGVRHLVKERFAEAEILQTGGAHKPVSSLSFHQVQLSSRQKFEELMGSLKRLNGRGLVFVNSRARCKELAERLEKRAVVVCQLHADLERAERTRSLRRFREDDGLVMVCTELAARGLDIPEVNWIVNYDMPRAPALYLHRIGRTARAGRSGLVIDFVTDRDKELVEKLRRRRVSKGAFELDEPVSSYRGKRGGPPGEKRGNANRRKGEHPKGREERASERGGRRGGPQRGKGRGKHRS